MATYFSQSRPNSAEGDFLNNIGRVFTSLEHKL